MVVTNKTTKDEASSTIKSGDKSPLTWREKLNKVIKNITVEPIVAAYIMPSVLANLATQNLNLEKACRVNMNYGDEICDALTRRETSNYTMEEETIQKMVAHMVAWKTMIQSLFPCLLILFWGSWSDRHHRRKPCIMIPIIGELLGCLGIILCVFFERTPMEVAGLTEAIFPALSGGWFVLLMGVFSYIADITTEEERTLRIGILNVCYSVGVPIGTALSGVLLNKIGFYGVFSISAGLYVFCLVYGIFYLPEARPRCIQTESKVKSKSLLADFFDKEHVMETFRVAFKKGENKRRQRVILLMIVMMAIMGPMYGEINVMYLYTRYRFNWNEVDFSVFNTFAVVIGLIGALISVGFLSHKLKIDDALIGVLSSVCKILSGFFYGFATMTWHMYVGAIVEIFNGTSFIAMRSMATKLVSKEELGKVNSLFGVVEALMPVIFAPMYSTLYAATIKVFPGAFYMIGFVVTVFAVIIFLWMYNFQRQLNRKMQQNYQESAIDTNGSISTVDAIALVSEAKGHLNGIVINALHEHICEHNCQANNCVYSRRTDLDNKAYMPDTVDNGDMKTENNTNL